MRACGSTVALLALVVVSCSALDPTINDIQAVVTSILERGTGDANKKLEQLTVRLDEAGCYNVAGTEELLLKLCEDDAGARKPLVHEGKLLLFLKLGDTSSSRPDVALFMSFFSFHGTS